MYLRKYNYLYTLFFFFASLITFKDYEPIAITNNNYDDQPPVVNDQYMVWRADSNKQYNLMVHDFEKDTSYQITQGSNNVWACLNDRFVVWNMQSDTDDEIWAYDLLLRISYPLTNNLSDDLRPTISENYIAWENNNGYESNIVLYNFKQASTINITNYQNNIKPNLDGDYLTWIVHTDHPEVSDQIMLYDIENQQTLKISTHETISCFKMKNNYIAWDAFENDSYGIYLYDIKKQKTYNIKSDLATESYLELYPPYLAYTKNDGDDEVVLWNIETFTEKQLTDNNFDDSFPALNSYCVAWYSCLSTGIEEFLYLIDEAQTIQITNKGGFNLHVTLNENYLIWSALDQKDMDIEIYICPIVSLKYLMGNGQKDDGSLQINSPPFDKGK